METIKIDGNKSFHEILFFLLNLNVLESLSDQMQNHVSFDNPKIKISADLSLEILRNPIKSVIPYSGILLLNVYLDTSSISAKPFQVNRSDLKYGNCFSGTSFFCQTGPLWFKLVTVCLNTATQGSDDLVWRRDKTH